jgi:hypothetical protein
MSPLRLRNCDIAACAPASSSAAWPNSSRAMVTVFGDRIVEQAAVELVDPRLAELDHRIADRARIVGAKGGDGHARDAGVAVEADLHLVAIIFDQFLHRRVRRRQARDEIGLGPAEHRREVDLFGFERADRLGRAEIFDQDVAGLGAGIEHRRDAEELAETVGFGARGVEAADHELRLGAILRRRDQEEVDRRDEHGHDDDPEQGAADDAARPAVLPRRGRVLRLAGRFGGHAGTGHCNSILGRTNLMAA